MVDSGLKCAWRVDYSVVPDPVDCCAGESFTFFEKSFLNAIGKKISLTEMLVMQYLDAFLEVLLRVIVTYIKTNSNLAHCAAGYRSESRVYE